ncbi:hypothetical protein AB0K43_10795 [Kitasatospora sp. NPDC049258]|uniref:hypothetical protein n=1 Tax=Kitasatospora sp. NPDC049258 TaxID=3155394 RepID=UPI0034477134
MPTPLTDTARHLRTGWTVAGPLLSGAATGITATVAGLPPVDAALIAVLGAGLGVSAVGYLRGRADRVATDERAQVHDSRARSLSWTVTSTGLTAMWAWEFARHGVSAAQPYLALLLLAQASYAAALMWHRSRN